MEGLLEYMGKQLIGPGSLLGRPLAGVFIRSQVPVLHLKLSTDTPFLRLCKMTSFLVEKHGTMVPWESLGSQVSG
jgi:hypothetical protein